MKKLVPVLVVLAVAWFYGGLQETVLRPAPAISTPATQTPTAFFPGSQVSGSGNVVRVLPDDNDGSRHQRFIIRLADGRTLLIAHNIDLAPRVADIKPGDNVGFYGVFETNPQGGVIHWTHRDPQDRHVAGWLKHNGRTYQ